MTAKKTTDSKPRTRGQLAGDDVTLELRARSAGFWVITRDEHRTELDLIPAIARAASVPRIWDLARGVVNLDGKQLRSSYDGPEGPDEVLDMIQTRATTERYPDDLDRNVWIMRSLGPWLEGVGGALTLRKLQNMLRPDGLAYTPSNTAQAIIILSPNSPPPELSNGELKVIEWPLPDRDEIGSILDKAVNVLPDTDEKPLRRKVIRELKKTRDAAIDAAVGLSSQEIQTTFSRSLIESNTIDTEAIAVEKKRLVDQDPAMTYYPKRPGGFAAVGGLENLKVAGARTLMAYSPEARKYGLKSPSGWLLLGVSGCGKTMSCQALGSEWGWPVVRLDLNAMKGKYVGESEARLRQGFARIDALGQVIVYVDEVEKALEGAVSGSADGGVSADALGAILTWMQDRTSQAFVIMTANDPSKLPPEFLRKGRFDDIWFIDLPTAVERAAIVTATLRSNGRDAEKLGIDLDKVAAATESFTGAEIAALIEHDAMFAAFADGAREVTTDDLLEAARGVIPLARTSAEKIAKLRETWTGRAKPATRPDAVETATTERAGARLLDF